MSPHTEANQVCSILLEDRSGETLRKQESLSHRDSFRTTQEDTCGFHLYSCVLIWDLLFAPKRKLQQMGAPHIEVGDEIQCRQEPLSCLGVPSSFEKVKRC